MRVCIGIGTSVALWCLAKVRRLEGDLLLAHEQVERFDKALSVLRRDLLVSGNSTVHRQHCSIADSTSIDC